LLRKIIVRPVRSQASCETGNNYPYGRSDEKKRIIFIEHFRTSPTESRPVQLRPLKSLLKTILSLDKEFAEALDRYHKALGGAPGEKSGCFTESYSFAQPMFIDGKPSTDIPWQQLVPEGLTFPLGLILGGYVEVTDYIFGAGAPRWAVPQAILKPGNFIGHFEFMDWVTKRSAAAIPDWTITAGAASISGPFRTDNDAFAKHLRRKFGSHKVNEPAIKNESSLVKQLMLIDIIEQRFGQWATDVMYFPRDWLEPLREGSANKRIQATAWELRRILSERAWGAASRIRPGATSIAPFFFGRRASKDGKFTRPEVRERQQAIHIFTSLYDLYSGRRPMFVPERQNGAWGPIGEICEILKGYRDDENPFVLRPEYLSDTSKKEVAFMPVENIASDLVKGGRAHERALLNTLNVIDTAARHAQAGSMLSQFNKMIEALAVRLPASRAANRTRDGSIVASDVVRNFDKDNKDKGVTFVAIKEGHFFGPYDITLDKPGAEFFKTCIRFAISS
jgi:hypothetical protein